jgi:hypothetical protein
MADVCGDLASGPPGYEGRASPLIWREATTAVEGTSEDYLRAIMPPFSWLVRHQVAIGWICIGVPPGPWGPWVATNSVLNTVYAAIPYSPNGSTFVAQTKLGGSPDTPPSSVCLDSPQSSESVTKVYNNPPNEGDIDGVCNPATQACADAGIYGMWALDDAGAPANTVAIANGANAEIDVEKHKVNNGPETGNFEELWEAESTNAGITAEWVGHGAVFAEDIVLPVNTDEEQHEDLLITCAAAADNEWGLVVLKNLLSPIPNTEDTYLDDNAFTFVVLVKCGTPATTPEVDKEVALIRAQPSHVVISTGGTAPVAIDELKVNQATSNVLGDEWLVAEVGDVVAPFDPDPLGPDLILAWVNAPNPGAVTVTAEGRTTQTPVFIGGGTPSINFPVNEWPGQADVNAQLNITCRATTPPGLYPVVVKAIDLPKAGFESKPSDNAQRKVITVRCGGAAPDGIVDGNGLYPRWTIFQSQGSTSLARAGDLRKVFKSPPSIVSDTGYVERIIDLQCFWMDDDGCTTCDGNSDTIISETESWTDDDMPAGIDPDGDCLAAPSLAQPGHPVDPLDEPTGTECDPSPYSEEPRASLFDPYDTAADSDCDTLVDGIEKAWGSNPLLADSDGDGAPDFVEMFQFTNPVNPDTDGDGLLDRPENNYLAAAAGVGDPSGKETGIQCDNVVDDDNDGFVNDGCPQVGVMSEQVTLGQCSNTTDDDITDTAETTIGRRVNDGCPTVTTEIVNLDDNCPSVYNPTQLNSDGQRRPNAGIAGDYASQPNGDKMGDACDEDDDNDGATDGYELSTLGGKVASDPLKFDTDCDTVGDGAEWRYYTNPNDVWPACQQTIPPTCSKPVWSNIVDQTYYRGCNISVNTAYSGFAGYNVVAGIEYDPDGDGTICPADTDSDYPQAGRPNLGGEMADRVEGFGYGVSIISPDTDGDGCEDWVEVGDVNGDRAVDSGDQGQMNRRIAGIIASDCVSCGSCVADRIFDLNKDGVVDSGDQGQMNRNTCMRKNWGGCPACPPEN